MKRSLRSLLPLLVVAGCVCLTRPAKAMGPVGIEVGAQVGGGTNPDSVGLNPLGLGLGLRGGVTVLGGLYGGLKGMAYLGNSEDFSIQLASGHLKDHAWQAGIEAGWGFKLEALQLTIRPQLGVGNIWLSASVENLKVQPPYGFAVSDRSSLFLEPGVTSFVSVGLLYVGADINYLWISHYEQQDGYGPLVAKGAMTAHGQVGVQF